MPKLTLVPRPPERPPAGPPPLLREAVGAVLRAERTAQRRTLADVAAGARVSLPYLSEVERGRKEPSSEVLAAVCGALDLTLVDLLHRTGSLVARGTDAPVVAAPRVSLSLAA
ncbi:helix-turn-helix domain-containing protein [Kineococcus rhizosphaerae]|uniref:Helix-turn-helix protein n=1 Tax=Kineococcus rhizosphaerae TaxID=559628 RepID=A0A2T0R6Z1_9ACTN|nr:helix-turn-helix transcriptional regulator [Kineococcus rhizosphaerae]PRY16937.1 helix-turn-helix protein [Kineococcus rhizosphaerae]